ncbi:MAG: RsmE family RNA methyltransferase [Aquihabitans sp.]
MIPSDGGPLVFVDNVDHPVIGADDYHHLARVRRVRDGNHIIVCDGRGRWATARFAGETPELDGEVQLSQRTSLSLSVAFALAKGEKPEMAVQKLTELGIDRIRPFVAARSVVRWDAAKIEQARLRLNKVAREAAMQSRSAWIPDVDAVTTFAEVVADPQACLADRGGAPPTLDRPLILVGPEGGWDFDEQAVDLPTVSLGDGVLRAETAAIAAGVLLSALRSGRANPG